MKKIMFYALLIIAVTGSLFSCAQDNPEIGKSARYCNPLPMVIGPGGNASGDRTPAEIPDR